MRSTLVLMITMAAAMPLAAQTVTPSNSNGWVFGDGSSGTSPAVITNTQPFDGNGSIQFTVSASNQQPLAVYLFSPLSLTGLSSLSLGYSFLTPTGTVPASSPTIRLLLSGLANAGQSGRSDGSLGWYNNGSSDSWQTASFSLTDGDFFFRVGGKGQASDDCTGTALSFDDRRQTIADWTSTCVGGTTIDLSNASVVGVEVDWGTFVAPGTTTSWADDVNFSIGSNTGDYNFETDLAPVPEPATISMLGMGLVGLAGLSRRKRRR